MKTFVIAATAALSLSILANAHAGAVNAAPAVTVRYADLDLGSNAGSETLYKRLTVAARSVCRELDPRNFQFSDLKPLKGMYQACMDKAVVGAVAKINRPAFTSYVSAQMTLPDTLTNIRVAAK